MTFPDLRRRDLTLTPVATSRYIEEFREVLPLGFVLIAGLHYLNLPARTPTSPNSSVVDVESVSLTRGGSPLIAGTDYEVATKPGTDIRTIVLKAGTPPREVVVSGVRGTVLATRRRPEPLTVPSAVRPTPPKPLYAVPAFAVSRGVVGRGGVATASRGPSRLRIWLERPWWSSGDKEQLAVVTSHNGPVAGTDDQRASQLVSLYGADPTLRQRAGVSRLQSALTTGVTVSDLQLEEELGFTPLAVVRAHDVAYDAARDLYWTEVGFPALPAGTFVRLAVARYQSAVATGVPHLSRVVTMDPVQLLPSRSVSARRVSTGAGDVLVARVVGGTHLGGTDAERPFVRMSLQRRTVTGVDTELGWSTLAAVTVRAGSTYPDLRVKAPTTRGTHRLLFEEVEPRASRDAAGRLVDPAYAKTLGTGAGAVDDLTGERVVWVATTPLPR